MVFFIDVKIAHVCYIYFLQNVKYWHEICDVLIPILHSECEICEM